MMKIQLIISFKNILEVYCKHKNMSIVLRQCWCKKTDNLLKNYTVKFEDAIVDLAFNPVTEENTIHNTSLYLQEIKSIKKANSTIVIINLIKAKIFN